MAVFPDRSVCRSASTPQPAAVTAPNPVMTTRRLLGTGPRFRLGTVDVSRDEVSKAVDGSKHGLIDFVALDLDAELFFERDDELESIDRIETELLAEQRRVILNFVDRETVEPERFDDQLLQLLSDRR